MWKLYKKSLTADGFSLDAVDLFILAVEQKFRHALGRKVNFKYALMVLVVGIEEKFFDDDEEKIGFDAERDGQV